MPADLPRAGLRRRAQEPSPPGRGVTLGPGLPSASAAIASAVRCAASDARRDHCPGTNAKGRQRVSAQLHVGLFDRYRARPPLYRPGCSGASGCEQLAFDVRERLELERVAGRVEQEQRRLLAGLAAEAHVRLDTEGRPGRA